MARPSGSGTPNLSLLACVAAVSALIIVISTACIPKGVLSSSISLAKDCTASSKLVNELFVSQDITSVPFLSCSQIIAVSYRSRPIRMICRKLENAIPSVERIAFRLPDCTVLSQEVYEL